jgi:hypothetical protein
VLRAAGGKLTDLFGAPLRHLVDRPGRGLVNELGVLATSAGGLSISKHSV